MPARGQLLCLGRISGSLVMPPKAARIAVRKWHSVPEPGASSTKTYRRVGSGERRVPQSAGLNDTIGDLKGTLRRCRPRSTAGINNAETGTLGSLGGCMFPKASAKTEALAGPLNHRETFMKRSLILAAIALFSVSAQKRARIQ